MKKYTLNIGLDIGDRADALSLSRVTLAVERAIEPHGRILSLNIHRSSSENTAVVVVESVDLAGGRWWHLSSELEQEAVSVWDEDRATGYLYGPEAVRWGLFNPEFFLLPDGMAMNAQRTSVEQLVNIAQAYRNYLRTAAHTDGEVQTYEHICSILAKFGK